jgi:probable blue pigment (indigoidine) exporter
VLNKLLLATAVAPALWGTTYATTTVLLPPGHPVLAAVLRSLPAGLVLLMLAPRTLRVPRGAWWWRAAVLGTLNIGLFFALLFVAAERLPGGVAATAGAVQPLVVAGLAALALGEPLRVRTVAAGAAGVVGVGLLVLRAQARLDAIGVAAALGGALSMALGIVLTKRWGRPVPLPAFTAWQLLAGGLVLVPVLVVVEGLPASGVPGTAVAGYTYLSVVGTAVAYVLWFRGLSGLPAGVVSLLGLLSPVVATAIGWLGLGQGLTGGQLAGLVLVLGAVALGTRPPRRRPAVADLGHRAVPERLHAPRPVEGPAAALVEGAPQDVRLERPQGGLRAPAPAQCVHR